MAIFFIHLNFEDSSIFLKKNCIDVLYFLKIIFCIDVFYFLKKILISKINVLCFYVFSIFYIFSLISFFLLF
jgi:hypothetical protein